MHIKRACAASAALCISPTALTPSIAMAGPDDSKTVVTCKHMWMRRRCFKIEAAKNFTLKTNYGTNPLKWMTPFCGWARASTIVARRSTSATSKKRTPRTYPSSEKRAICFTARQLILGSQIIRFGQAMG